MWYETASPESQLVAEVPLEAIVATSHGIYGIVGWAQVWDVAPAQLHKTHYLLPRRRCGCGVTTTAAPPFGRAGTPPGPPG